MLRQNALLGSLGLLCALTTNLPDATAAGPIRYQRKISPQVELWLRVPRFRSRTPLPKEGKTPAELARTLKAPVLVVFAAAPDKDCLARLRRAGVDFRASQKGEGLRHLGRYYPAASNLPGLRALKAEARVRRVDLDVLPWWAPRPLKLTASETQAAAAWRNAAAPAGLPLTGKGVTIGNLDSGIDVYHPAFFRADGALYAWIDVDGNGAFDPGKDGVDLDGDGKVGQGEVLGLIDARVTGPRQMTSILDSKNGRYDPRRDWLYADTNGNGARDFGAAAGFDDKTATFGEPLFVAEDMDGDGKLGVAEKLRALKTPKVSDTYFDGVVRTRGVELSKTPNDVAGLHGTGTSGIMVSGQRGFLDQVGLAPDADLVMAVSQKRDPQNPRGGLSDALIWMVKERKVDLVLHEYAPWAGLHLDGSSSHEQLLDQASTLGIPQVVPAGNLAMAGDKHAEVDVAVGGTVTLPFEVPAPSPLGTHTFAHLSFLWRDLGVPLTFELKGPDGTVKTLTTTNTQGDWWDTAFTVAYYSWREDSPRGTAMFNIYLIGQSGQQAGPIPHGTWTLTVKNPGTTAVNLWGYTSDAVSSWGPGIGFRAHTKDEGTVCWPATADTAITVGAYAAHVGAPYEDEVVEKSGQLRDYSSRGKRVDGVSILDVAAPDNPLSTVNRFVAGPMRHDLGEYIIFGGTSGAGPHVAAGVALLRQKEPKLSAADVKKRIREACEADSDVGAVPSDSWGMGKLRIFRTLFGRDPVESTSPKVSIQAPEIYAGDEVTFVAKVEDAEDAADKLRVRWDEAYDGSYDSWAPAGQHELKRRYDTAGEVVWIRVEVEDGSGLRARAVVKRVVQPQSARPDGGVGGDGGAGGGSSSGCHVAAGAGSAPFALALLLLALLYRRRR